MMRRVDHEAVHGCGWWDAGDMTTSPVAAHACANPQSDNPADHHCLGPRADDEPWYCVDCAHVGPEPEDALLGLCARAFDVPPEKIKPSWPLLPDGVQAEDFTLIRTDVVERDPVTGETRAWTDAADV